MSAQPVHCSRVTDTAQAVRYLRRDVLKNRGLLAAIERNVPPVPREIWAAKDPHGNVAGLMLIENFPHAPGVEFRAELPAALPGLLRCLEPGKTYAFAVPADLREEFLKNLPHARLGFERIDLTLSQDSFRPVQPAGEARPLTPADKALIDSFPPGGPHEPPLDRYVEWAADDPDKLAVWSLLAEGELVCFVGFSLMLDNIWEVDTIRTRPARRGKGHAKALLSHASGQLLRRGIVPLYSVDADNEASLRTARAVGYREAYRVFGCEAAVPSPAAGLDAPPA